MRACAPRAHTQGPRGGAGAAPAGAARRDARAQHASGQGPPLGCAPLADERPATNLGLTVANLSLLKSIRLADDGAFHLVGEAAVDAGSGLCGKERYRVSDTRHHKAT